MIARAGARLLGPRRRRALRLVTIGVHHHRCLERQSLQGVGTGRTAAPVLGRALQLLRPARRDRWRGTGRARRPRPCARRGRSGAAGPRIRGSPRRAPAVTDEGGRSRRPRRTAVADGVSSTPVSAARGTTAPVRGAAAPGPDVIFTPCAFLRISSMFQPVSWARFWASFSWRAAELAAVAHGLLALRLPLPGMAQDVAALEVLAGPPSPGTRGPRGSGRRRSGRAGGRRTSAGCPATLAPELGQLLARERIGRAGVAPGHVPGVFEEHRAHVLAAHLVREHGLVEVLELRFDEQRQVHPRGQLHRPVVRRLDAALAGQGEDEQVLRSRSRSRCPGGWAA